MSLTAWATNQSAIVGQFQINDYGGLRAGYSGKLPACYSCYNNFTSLTFTDSFVTFTGWFINNRNSERVQLQILVFLNDGNACGGSETVTVFDMSTSTYWFGALPGLPVSFGDFDVSYMPIFGQVWDMFIERKGL